jgi:hypothetical protein
MKTKQCIKCQEIKPLEDYYKLNEANAKKQCQEDGHDYYCKYCRNGSAIKSHRGNKNPCSIEGCERPHYAKTWCRMHYARVLRTGNTDTKLKPVDGEKVYIYKGYQIRYHRERHLMTTYKMTLDEFVNRAIKGCEICGDKPEKSLHVDHDHNCCKGPISCGECVRGIICNKCNKAVDKYETGTMRPDNPHMDRIKEYVNEYTK